MVNFRGWTVGSCFVGKEFHALLKELFFFCPTSTRSGDEFLPARRSTGVPQADKIRLHRGDLT